MGTVSLQLGLRTILLLSLASQVTGTFTTSCRRCICLAEGSGDDLCGGMMNRCTDIEPLGCGPYTITKQFWCDARGIPPDGELCEQELTTEWQACVTAWQCANDTMNAYMERHAPECMEGGEEATCENYAKMYFGGDTNCQQEEGPADDFWNNYVRPCCIRSGSCDVSNK